MSSVKKRKNRRAETVAVAAPRAAAIAAAANPTPKAPEPDPKPEVAPEPAPEPTVLLTEDAVPTRPARGRKSRPERRHGRDHGLKEKEEKKLPKDNKPTGE